MTPDPGPGIPGWFIAFGVLIILLGVGTTVWRISAARSLAKDAGLDPNKATAVALLSDDGVGAAYLASTLAPRRADESARPSPAPAPRTAEQRLRELKALHEQHLISDTEYEAQRRAVLGSI